MSKKFIPLSVPNLKGRELEYVTHAIETEWVSTGGPYINEFENQISSYVNTAGAVSVQNGTSGLHVSLKVCGILSNDEVIVPTLTFIAAVNPVKYVGAHPVFIDCDESLCIDPEKVRAFIRKECVFKEGKLKNKKTNRHIKAIVVVHVFGNMAKMKEIMEISEEFNLKVIEDATEALGTYYIEGPYKNKFAGTIGTVGVYSFNGNKIITTGGGGMIVSNDLEILKKAKHLTTQAKSDELYYTHDEIGFNYRMTNLQAGIGIAQLEQLESFIKTKKENYELYKQEILNIDGLSLIEFDKNIRSNHWFYALYIEDSYALSRDELIQHLSKKGIQARPIWSLISDQIPYKDSEAHEISMAKKYLKHIINIPCSSNLTQEEVKYVLNNLRQSQC